MKSKIIVAVLCTFGFSNTVLAANVCESVTPSPWREVSVEQLQDATQVLFQVKARGIYRVADLICNHDTCTGFENGSPTTGRIIQTSPNDSMDVISLEMSGVEFTCK